MMRPQPLPDICERLIELFLKNATRVDFCLKLLCDVLQLNPDKLWKLCQDEFGQSPSDVLDWARAKAFLDIAKANPSIKLRRLGKLLGFKSESAFNEFAHRAFDATPKGAKTNPQIAEQKARERYFGIQACYEALLERKESTISNAPTNQQRKRDVDGGRNPETESRNGIPKRNPETESRNGIPKRNPESENSWKKEKKKVR